MERLSVTQASKRLKISESAVRQRVYRGTLQGDKDPDGRLFVYITEQDMRDNGETTDVFEDYINVLKSQVESLERDKEALERDKEHLRQESERKDHIIMSLTQRIPAIEPPTDVPPDERESPVTASEEAGKGQVLPDPETAEPQPWWRRIFR